MTTQSIHMGHGQMVDIVDLGNSQWELAFSEAGKPDYKAPPVEEIKMDAIDDNGAVYALSVAKGSKVSTVAVTGHVDRARRVRVMVLHGSHFHTRETAVPGAPPLEAKAGVSGGAAIPLGQGIEVEVTRSGPGRWLLKWHKDGVATEAAPEERIEVEAIGEKAEDYQVRQLLLMAGPDRSTLIASGKVDDATYIRLIVKDDAGSVKRSLPIQ